MTKIISSLRTAFESRRAYNRTIVEIERMVEREQTDVATDRDSRIVNAHGRIDGAAR